MQKTFITMLLSGMFPIYAVENSPAIPNEAESQNPDSKIAQSDAPKPQGDGQNSGVQAGRDWKALGLSDGKEIQAEQARAETFARNRIIERAMELAGMPAQDDWLEGYANSFSADTNNPTRKVRKAEAKAVFEAWTKPVSGTVDQAREKLVSFSGHDNEFFDLAREIRGKKGGGQPAGSRHKSVSAGQFEKVADKMPLLNASQSLEVTKAVTATMAKLPNADILLIRKLYSVDLPAIERVTDDAGIMKFVSDTRERAQQILDAHDAQEKLQKETKAAAENKTDMAKVETPAAPAPAQAQAAAA